MMIPRRPSTLQSRSSSNSNQNRNPITAKGKEEPAPGTAAGTHAVAPGVDTKKKGSDLRQKQYRLEPTASASTPTLSDVGKGELPHSRSGGGSSNSGRRSSSSAPANASSGAATPPRCTSTTNNGAPEVAESAAPSGVVSAAANAFNYHHRKTLEEEAIRRQTKIRIQHLVQDETRTKAEIDQVLRMIQDLIVVQERTVLKQMRRQQVEDDKQRALEEERIRLERLRREAYHARHSARESVVHTRRSLAAQVRMEHERNKELLRSGEDEWMRAQSAAIASKREAQRKVREQARERANQQLRETRAAISKQYGALVAGHCLAASDEETPMMLQMQEDNLKERLDVLAQKRKAAILNLATLVRTSIEQSAQHNQSIQQEHERMLIQQRQSRILKMDREEYRYRAQMADKRAQHRTPSGRSRNISLM